MITLWREILRLKNLEIHMFSALQQHTWAVSEIVGWQRFQAAGCSFCESSHCHQPSADHDRHEFTDAPHFTLTETFTGWWCNNHLEKWWSSSMGFGWHPIYELWNIKAMFETNQIIIIVHPIIDPLISIYSFHYPINILWMEENLHQLIDGLSHYL